MGKKSALRTYHHLARYYDQVMESHPLLFKRVRHHLLKNVLPEVHSMCDLGCGSGETALDFAQRGLKVFAVDLSAHQIQHVERKARKTGLSIHTLQGDMRTFELPEPVDLITCEFDALNHVPNHSDLPRVLKCVARALRPGGVFYFDVNTEKAFHHIWSNTTWVDTNEFALSLEGDYDQRRRRAVLHLDWFFPEGDLWRREQERLEEVCWTPTEIRQALRRAGFHRIRAWDGAPFFQGWDWELPGCRTFYLARVI